MPLLESLDRINERALVHGGVRRDHGAVRKVAYEAELLGELRNAGIGVAWCDRFFRDGELATVGMFGEGEVGVQGFERAAVAGIGRFDLS